ncbi:hypothetical protein OZX67_03870 [Bifidobacterium sp. ESL0728]|uniref:hypothetical protein n=1 Tax=Bifidobacterium sp. ESL0728 TaxID=2983220 RepID=UPI0023FA2E66|nr:hypothetical protein [Bifidobacterium sp. ESL0728]WEV59685.1 hypothetical protein OZX67_03870 [Bifidobacterium sp. ESL0728]
MGYKNIIGAVSDSSCIFKYSDDEQALQIFTNWKNGKPKMHLRRHVETIPYANLAEYTTFIETDTKNTGGVGTALIGDVLFGPLGAIGGAILGRKTTVMVKQLGLAFKTKEGDEYVFPLVYSIRGLKSDSGEVMMANRRLEKMVAVFERIGTPFNADWHTSVDAWMKQ